MKGYSKLSIQKKGKTEIIFGKSLSQEMYKVTSRGPFQPNLLYDSMKS